MVLKQSREENVELIYNKYKFELHLFKNIEMSTSKSKSTRKVKINTEEKSSLLITSNSTANSSKTKKSINSSILTELEQKLWLKNKTEIVLLQNMLIVSAGVEISEMNTSSLITQEESFPPLFDRHYEKLSNSETSFVKNRISQMPLQMLRIGTSTSSELMSGSVMRKRLSKLKTFLKNTMCRIWHRISLADSGKSTEDKLLLLRKELYEIKKAGEARVINLDETAEEVVTYINEPTPSTVTDITLLGQTSESPIDTLDADVEYNRDDNSLSELTEQTLTARESSSLHVGLPENLEYTKYYPAEWLAWLMFGPTGETPKHAWITPSDNDVTKPVHLERKGTSRKDQKAAATELKIEVKATGAIADQRSRFLDNQERDIDVYNKELDIRQQELDLAKSAKKMDAITKLIEVETDEATKSEYIKKRKAILIAQAFDD